MASCNYFNNLVNNSNKFSLVNIWSENYFANDFKRKLGLLYTISFNKFYVDELYALLTKYFVDGIGKILYWIDVNIVDGFINGLAKITDFIGDVLRKTQTGQFNNMSLSFFAEHYY